LLSLALSLAPTDGRLLESYRAIVAHEALCDVRYSWILRLRTDLVGAPRSLSWPWKEYEPRLSNTTVYTGGRFKHGQHRDAWTPADMFALVPRSLGSRFFSLARSTLQCQKRSANARICGHTVQFYWATPECIYKTHLSRCIGLQHVNLSMPLTAQKLESTPSAHQIPQPKAKPRAEVDSPVPSLLGGVLKPSNYDVLTPPVRDLFRQLGGYSCRHSTAPSRQTEGVLVVVIASTRAGAITWSSFKQHVLLPLKAHLALAVGKNTGEGDMFRTHARYVWEVDEPPNVSARPTFYIDYMYSL
jgi:hypothetical protein